MGYTLKAYIGKEDSLIPILEKYSESQKVALNNGLFMIPMTDELFDEINDMKHMIFQFEKILNKIVGRYEKITLENYSLENYDIQRSKALLQGVFDLINDCKRLDSYNPRR